MARSTEYGNCIGRDGCTIHRVIDENISLEVDEEW